MILKSNLFYWNQDEGRTYFTGNIYKPPDENMNQFNKIIRESLNEEEQLFYSQWLYIDLVPTRDSVNKLHANYFSQ